MAVQCYSCGSFLLNPRTHECPAASEPTPNTLQRARLSEAYAAFVMGEITEEEYAHIRARIIGGGEPCNDNEST